MNVFINGTDRTGDIIRNSISIDDEMQEKANTAKFELGAGSVPDLFEEVKIYEPFEISAVDGTTITIDYEYLLNQDTNIFRVGEKIVIDIGESGEIEKTITALASSNGSLKMTVAPAGSDGTVGKLAGTNEFNGNILNIQDSNQGILQNIKYTISCADYTRVFDKANINDTWTSRDARYIINSFCNTTINRNEEVDEMNYADNAAIQAEWIESGDGGNPTVDTSDYREGTSSGVLPWSNSGGTATFEATPTSINVDDYTGASSGAPTKGVLGFWYKAVTDSDITSFDIRVGSDSSNYASFTITPTDSEWTFEGLKFTDASITGTPDWTAVDYLAIVVTEVSDGSIKIDGVRFLEEEYFRHYPYVQESSTFDEFRVAEVKPSETMQRMSDELKWYWYVDYDRNIHLFDESTNNAPFNIDETSNNFTSLSINYDSSRLINRQKVKGGDETSTTKYNQTVEGDGVVREWITKNKFKNLQVFLDDNSSNAAAEAGTTATNITITGHGLETDDYIVNRTRSNAVRKITKVDDDNFTVETVSSQTSGDTISFFVEQAVGVEGIQAEAGNDYMSNFNEKSIRAAEATDTLLVGEFLLFRYNEVFPIIVRRSENASITNMKNVLGHSTGVFDGQPIIDRTIKSRSEAIAVAKATLNKYSNTVITATFSTRVAGLRTGQLINIKDTASSTRNINQNFLIQKVKTSQVEEGETSYTITCSSLVFGMIELLQQLLRQGRKLDVSEDEIIENVEDAFESILVSDLVTSTVGGEIQSETIQISDSVTSEVITPPFKWQPSVSNGGRWNLSQWG
jgi:hypothetical protein